MGTTQEDVEKAVTALDSELVQVSDAERLERAVDALTKAITAHKTPNIAATAKASIVGRDTGNPDDDQDDDDDAVTDKASIPAEQKTDGGRASRARKRSKSGTSGSVADANRQTAPMAKSSSDDDDSEDESDDDEEDNRYYHTDGRADDDEEDEDDDGDEDESDDSDDDEDYDEEDEEDEHDARKAYSESDLYKSIVDSVDEETLVMADASEAITDLTDAFVKCLAIVSSQVAKVAKDVDDIRKSQDAISAIYEPMLKSQQAVLEALPLLTQNVPVKNDNLTPDTVPASGTRISPMSKSNKIPSSLSLMAKANEVVADTDGVAKSTPPENMTKASAKEAILRAASERRISSSRLPLVDKYTLIEFWNRLSQDERNVLTKSHAS